jgi:hypothetical protein
MFQVMDAKVRYPSLRSRAFPSGVVHPTHWFSFVREDMRCMLASSGLDDGPRDAVTHDQSIELVLHVSGRDDKGLMALNFPFPA